MEVLKEPKRKLLEDINLSIDAGESVALLGESGSGKTMLCRAIAGVMPQGVEQVSGRVDLLRLPTEERARAGRGPAARAGRAGITMVPQIATNALPPLSTPLEFLVGVARWNLGMSDHAARETAARLLARVGFPAGDPALHRRPHQLSGGMAQRVAIAAALATAASVLVLDEPSSGLDPITRHEIALLLNAIREKEGCTLLLATHDLVLARAMCERFAVLRQGKVVAVGEPQHLLTTGSPYLRDLLAILDAAHDQGLEQG